MGAGTGVPDRPGAAAGRDRHHRPGRAALTPLPRRTAAWLALAGLALGASLAALFYAVVTLHEHDMGIDRRICAAENTDRAVDRAIVSAAGLHVTVPPLTAKECP